MKMTKSTLPYLYDVLVNASNLESVEEIKAALKPYYDGLVDLYENDLILMEEDYRTGTDTYGYDNLEHIQFTLSYISDRYKCGFRVRWLIELINPNYILWEQ